MQKRNSLLTILFLFLSISSFAQQATIKGFVYEKESGEPMIYTNVVIKGTTIGVQTDINGYFSFPQLAPGNYTLTTTLIGYDTATADITLTEGSVVNTKLFIGRQAQTLEGVEISARRTEKTTKVNIGTTTITPTDIKLLPSAGGEPDIAQFLQVLPGVIFTGDQGGQLYIRGGSPTQTGILLDGVTIYNPFHSIGLYSVFETDAIRSADVISSGFGAQYGNRTSAIVDIRTKDGNKNRLSGKLSASPIMAHAMLEGPLMKPKAAGASSISFLLSAKHSYLQSVSKSLYGSFGESVKQNGLPFEFTDLYGKVTLSGDNGSKLNVFGFNFDDRAKIINPDNYAQIAGLNWKARGGGATFVITPGSSSALISGKLAFSDYDVTIKDNSTLQGGTRRSGISGFEGGIDFTYFLKNYSLLKYGFEVSGLSTDLDYSATPTTDRYDLNRRNTIASVFVNFRKNFGDKFILDPSIRFQYYATLSKFSPEPRLGLKYNVARNVRLKAAGGIYSQNIISTKSDKDVVNFFTGFLLSPDERVRNLERQQTDQTLQTAYHAAGGVEVDIKDVEINIEPWYKVFNNYIELNRYKKSQNDPNFVSGNGKATGVDMSVKYNYNRIYLYAVFSYQKILFETFDNRDSVVKYPPPFDRRFNMNLFGAYTAGKKKDWDFALRYNLGSPFPFTQTQGFFESLNLTAGNSNVTGANGNINTIYSEILNGGRLSWYHRVDLSVKKRFVVSKNSNIETTFSVTNVADRNNIFYVDRQTNVKVYQLPIFPSLSIGWNF